jgi:hypothetical protein
MSTQTKLLQLTERERAEFLQDHADTIQEGQYFKQFDPEDREQNQAEYMDKSIELQRVLDEYKQIKEDYKSKIKMLEAHRAVLITERMQNGEWLDGKQFGFADQDRGLMEYFDATGQLISSRRLLPNERQISIFNKASNGE